MNPRFLDNFDNFRLEREQSRKENKIILTALREHLEGLNGTAIKYFDHLKDSFFEETLTTRKLISGLEKEVLQ